MWVGGALCSLGRAQGLQVDVEEFKRLQGEMADLRDANSAQQKRISELTRRVENLQEEVKSANQRMKLNNEDFVTREALKKVLDQVAEVDGKRENDRKVILEQLDKLGKTLSQPPIRTQRETRGNPRENASSSREPERNGEPEVIEGKVYPHKVEERETFGGILEKFNATLKEDGRKRITTADVRRVNPGFDPNRIRVGQEILLPVPDKK